MTWPPADGTPYMPSNGSDFDLFYARWCERCANDDPDGDACELIGCSMCGDQPAEWTWKDRAPHCSAFAPYRGRQPLPEPRCPLTLEMF
jgi:hypothetical protein